MKENKYDDNVFFEKYGKMPRSIGGLDAAGEWPVLKNILPDLNGKRVLDLGCGYGWHCRYAIENKAKEVIGVDISEKMLQKAISMTNETNNIKYIHKPIEEVEFNSKSFDVVISSLALHYIKLYDKLVNKIYKWLDKDGFFSFSVEHPIFTAYGNQDWIYSEKKEILHWPVDNYFYEGKRNAIFLGENVIKYHRTLTTYLNALLKNGFKIIDVIEPRPDENIENMKNELRRPMMLLISVMKE
jgi:SAM-dependent methyltransferase